MARMIGFFAGFIVGGLAVLGLALARAAATYSPQGQSEADDASTPLAGGDNSLHLVNR